MKGKASKKQDSTDQKRPTARRQYLVGFPSAPSQRARTRLSSKNQITLPVSVIRELGLQAGDEIDMSVWGDELIMNRRPQTPEEWRKRFMGSVRVPGWETKDSIDAYIREERDSWTRDDADS